MPWSSIAPFLWLAPAPLSTGNPVSAHCPGRGTYPDQSRELASTAHQLSSPAGVPGPLCHHSGHGRAVISGRMDWTGCKKALLSSRPMDPPPQP